MEYRFIADVHLGKLAKLLRMLGFNTMFNSNYTKAELITTALQQNGILLTRNVALHKTGTALSTLIIIDQDPFNQLQQVVTHFQLISEINPFTICMICNGVLHLILKEKIYDRLPDKTRKEFDEFWQCDNCHRLYWKGSHYEKMLEKINQIKVR